MTPEERKLCLKLAQVIEELKAERDSLKAEIAALREQPVQPAPPECETEGEKRAYAFGWFKALEHARAIEDKS